MATIFAAGETHGGARRGVSNFDVGYTDAGTRSAEQFGGERGAPKWPEAPGVCKFRLIEKNDEVPGVPPVSISSHYFYSGAFYRNGRARVRSAARPERTYQPPSIYEGRDGAVLSLSYPILSSRPVPHHRQAVPLSYHCHSFCSVPLVVSSICLLPSPTPIFIQPDPPSLVYGRSPCTSIRVSLSVSFQQIYTLFFAANCLSLDAARGSTGEEWHNSARERATSGINGSCGGAGASGERGSTGQGWVSGEPGNAFNKDR